MKVAISSLLVLFFVFPSTLLAYSSCKACSSDHVAICDSECENGSGKQECVKKCGEEKCQKYCDPSYNHACDKCRDTSLNACGDQCRKDLKKGTPFEERRTCISTCMKKQCEAKCEGKKSKNKMISEKKEEKNESDNTKAK